MVYTIEAPTPEVLDNLYKQGGAQQEWVRLQQNPMELELDRLKFRWALEKAGWPCGDRRILDIGCSTGTLLEVAGEMADNKVEIYGVEINEEALKVAEERIAKHRWQAWLGRDCDGMGEGCVFDLVVLWEVLEHVLEPQAMLKRAWELVAPGGQLLLCVPNADSLAVRMLHEKASCFGLGHLQFYGPETLRAALNRVCGDVKIEFETIISWRNELLNWLNLKEPMAEDPLPVWGDWYLPSASAIHERLMGYKLVAWVRKPL